MGHGFRYRVEYQANSHTCAKEHGKPGHIAELWFLIIWPQSNPTKWTEVEPDYEDDVESYAENVKPAYVGAQEIQNISEVVFRCICEGYAQKNKKKYEYC